MNVNPIIIEMLKDIAPVYPDFYAGNNEEYFVFNYADERGAAYADDEEYAAETNIQVHFFTKNDPQRIKKTMVQRMKAADFIIQSVQTLRETERAYNHVVVSALIYSYMEE